MSIAYLYTILHQPRLPPNNLILILLISALIPIKDQYRFSLSCNPLHPQKLALQLLPFYYFLVLSNITVCYTYGMLIIQQVRGP